MNNKIPLLTISIKGVRYQVTVENTLETKTDGRGGCLFKFKNNGKTAFIPFEKFTFV